MEFTFFFSGTPEVGGVSQQKVMSPIRTSFGCFGPVGLGVNNMLEIILDQTLSNCNILQERVSLNAQLHTETAMQQRSPKQIFPVCANISSSAAN